MVILTTHDLADIEMLADRIVMIDKGVNVFDGTISKLKSKYGQIRELNFDTSTKDAGKKLSYVTHFHMSEEDITVTEEGSTIKVRFNSSVVPVSELLFYTLNTVRVNDISVKDADIEEIIGRLYQSSL